MLICMFVYVCPPLRLLITSGVMRCDIDRVSPYDWLNEFYDFYMAAVIGIVSGRVLSIHACHEN